MPVDQSASACRHRAAEMRSLAEKTYEPAFRRSCEELADGWEALARQQDALGGLTAGPDMPLRPDMGRSGQA